MRHNPQVLHTLTVLRLVACEMDDTTAQITLRVQSTQPIGGVGLVARARPPLACMTHDHLDHANEDMIHGLPIYAYALHRHDGAVLGKEPITEGTQLRGDGAKVTQCSRDLAVSADVAQTRLQGGLMHIETTTHRGNHWHRCVLLHEGDITGGQTTGPRLQVRYSHAGSSCQLMGVPKAEQTASIAGLLPYRR